MNDNIGEFLKSCEYSDAVSVQVLSTLLRNHADFKVICTQGALMASRRQQWATVALLSPNIEVEIENFVLFRATICKKQWDCFNVLSAQLTASGSLVVLQYVSPQLVAHDQWQSLQLVVAPLQEKQYCNFQSTLFKIALLALDANAFACLNVLEEKFQAQGQQLFDYLNKYEELAGLVKGKKDEHWRSKVECFNAWKERGLLEKALAQSPTGAMRSRKI